MAEPWETPATRQWIAWLLASHVRAVGSPLVADADPSALYDLDAVVVSHRCDEDPVFVYANRAAQRVWGYDWGEFIGLPSRLSAPPAERAGRGDLLRDGLARGAVRVRDLIRVRKDGRSFRVDEVLLWNVWDDAGLVVGQAATYARFALFPSSG